MAMMDTMGQAAAMTGGYGNSYAQGVGQQAYQGYLQQLNSKIPELYQLAMSKYQMEGNELKDQYSMLGAQEQMDYGRYRDTVSDYNTELDRLQNQFNAERDYDYSKWTDGRDFSYGQFADDRAYGYQTDRDKIADQQWQAEFNEAIRQFNFQNKLGEFAPKVVASSGSGYSGNPNPQPQPVDTPTEEETKMGTYVKNMLDNATGSRFNPQQVINANSNLSASEKATAQAILNEYIKSGYMK
jgi:hypothetical protein